MRVRIRNFPGSTMIVLAIILGTTAAADDLTLRIEQDLAELGYDTGAVDGEESLETTIAISQFQAENDLDVTGEITPQLAGILAAHKAGGEPAPATPASGKEAAAPESAAAVAPAATSAAAQAEADPAALQAAQQACLQEKIAAAEASKEKKRGFGRLLGAAARIAGRGGNAEIARTASDIYSANATAEDVSAAAKELGLSESDIEACKNPQAN